MFPGRLWEWRKMDPSPAAYAPPGAILEAIGQQPGMTRSLRVITRQHDAVSQLSVQRDLERTLERLGVSVSGMRVFPTGGMRFWTIW